MWLIPFCLYLCLALASQGGDAIEQGHQRNLIYVESLRAGFQLDQSMIALRGPTLRDGLGADQQMAALLDVCGSEQALENLLRDSVAAPFVLRVRDQKTKEATLRIVDFWFAVRADLDGLDPVELAGQASGKAAEAGNIRFENRLLSDEELKRSGRSAQRGRDLSRWYARIKGRILDRIALAVVDESFATRTNLSIVIASRTDPAFDSGASFKNAWWMVDDEAHGGSRHRFHGGLSYAKISQLRRPAGALLVEVHGVFGEPDAWFQGAPILRSKFAPVAQDQIRRLRRELLKNRKPAARSASAAP
jgi:hypothetical protein